MNRSIEKYNYSHMCCPGLRKLAPKVLDAKGFKADVWGAVDETCPPINRGL